MKNKPQYFCCFLLCREIEAEDNSRSLTGMKTNFIRVWARLSSWTFMECVQRKSWRSSSTLCSEFSAAFSKVTDTLSCTIHGGADHCVLGGDRGKVGSVENGWFGVRDSEKRPFGSVCLMSRCDVHTSELWLLHVDSFFPFRLFLRFQFLFFSSSRSAHLLTLFSFLCAFRRIFLVIIQTGNKGLFWSLKSSLRNTRQIHDTSSQPGERGNVNVSRWRCVSCWHSRCRKPDVSCVTCSWCLHTNRKHTH